MEVLEAVESRRAIRHFDPNYKMTEEEIHKLMSAVLLSPTAYNIQHWRSHWFETLNCENKFVKQAGDRHK